MLRRSSVIFTIHCGTLSIVGANICVFREFWMFEQCLQELLCKVINVTSCKPVSDIIFSYTGTGYELLQLQLLKNNQLGKGKESNTEGEGGRNK